MWRYINTKISEIYFTKEKNNFLRKRIDLEYIGQCQQYKEADEAPGFAEPDRVEEFLLRTEHT